MLPGVFASELYKHGALVPCASLRAFESLIPGLASSGPEMSGFVI